MFRRINVDGQEIDFSDGFEDLHTMSYREILEGKGFGVDDVRPSIEIVSHIRGAKLQPGKEDWHPFLEKALQQGRYSNGWPK